MLRLLAFLVLLMPFTASSQIVNPAIAPGGIILSGLVPPNVGGCWNSPTTTLTIPAGQTFAMYATSRDPIGPGSTMAGLTVRYAASTHTYSAGGSTFVWLGLDGSIAYTATNAAPNQYFNLLYVAGTMSCPPDGHQAMAYLCGYIELDGGGFPNWEGAENQACTGHGPALLSQSAQFQGNGLGVISNDPTTFGAEGIGGSALEVNPQIYTGRVVPGRAPQANDYVSQYGMYGQCAESYQQGLGCQYGSLITRIRNPNAATRDAELDLATIDPANNGGTGTLPRVSITAQGIACADARGNSPGGFTGSRTINCDDFDIGGVSLKGLLVRSGLLTQADLRNMAARQAAMPPADIIKPQIPVTP